MAGGPQRSLHPPDIIFCYSITQQEVAKGRPFAFLSVSFAIFTSMLLTMTLGGPRASSFPELLKHQPDQVATHSLPFGKAHVFFPSVEPACQMAFLVDAHSSDMEMGDGPYLDRGSELGRHFNHRPYTANVHLATALRLVFAELLAEDHAEAQGPLTLELAALPARDASDFETLFAPLGYAVSASPLPNPFSKTEPRCYELKLERQVHPAQALQELIAGLLCLDGSKLYWTSPEESAQLMAVAGPVIEGHPEEGAVRELLAAGQGSLFNPHLKKLALGSDVADWKEKADEKAAALEAKWGLDVAREEALLWLLGEIKPERVLDLGSGNGRLVWKLLTGNVAERVTGMDISLTKLQASGRNLVEWGLPAEKRQAVSLQNASVACQDERMQGFDAIVLQEVVCQLTPFSLRAATRNLFQFAQPQHLLITLPNADFNPLLEGLPKGAHRHPAHQFEWSAQQIQDWGAQVAEAHGYELSCIPIHLPDQAALPASFLLYFQTSPNS